MENPGELMIKLKAVLRHSKPYMLTTIAVGHSGEKALTLLTAFSKEKCVMCIFPRALPRSLPAASVSNSPSDHNLNTCFRDPLVLRRMKMT